VFEMPSLGPAELVVILIIVLLLFGAKKLPSLRSSIAKLNSRLNVRSAAALLAGSLLLSSLLGLYRDRLLNSMYLSTYPAGLDAYRAAFTVPDFMFYILVSGALSVTFIPVFNQRILSGNKKSAWQLSSSMINFLAMVTIIASILIIIFASPLVDLIAPGLTESGHALATSMMRVIAVNPFLFAIATVISSMQQAIGRFTFFALAPTLYNIGIIIGALYFTNGISIFGIQVFDGGIMGVALGVVLGAILQLIVSAIGLLGIGFDYEFKIRWKNKGFIKTLKLLPARSIDQAMDYFVTFVETNLASRMGAGMMSRYQQVLSLHSMPVNLIGVAISTAAFPSMTEQLVEGNTAAYRKQLQQVIRVIIWLALPVAVITFFARGYVVSFIKNGGDTIMATLLGILVVSILFRTIYHIAARSFYFMSRYSCIISKILSS
jgi:putative peptidoglycan lipid II flippase